MHWFRRFPKFCKKMFSPRKLGQIRLLMIVSESALQEDSRTPQFIFYLLTHQKLGLIFNLENLNQNVLHCIEKTQKTSCCKIREISGTGASFKHSHSCVEMSSATVDMNCHSTYNPRRTGANVAIFLILIHVCMEK